MSEPATPATHGRLVGIDCENIWRDLLIWRTVVEAPAGPAAVVPPEPPAVVMPPSSTVTVITGGSAGVSSGGAPDLREAVKSFIEASGAEPKLTFGKGGVIPGFPGDGVPGPLPPGAVGGPVWPPPAPPPPVTREVLDLESSRNQMPRFDLDAARWVGGVWAGRLRCLTDLSGEWRLWDGDGCGVFVNDGGSVIPQILQAVADAFATAMERIEEEYRLRSRSKMMEMLGAGASESDAKAAAEEVLVTGIKSWRMWRVFADRLRTEAGQNALENQLQAVCATNWRAFDSDVRWLAFRNGVVDLDELARMARERRGSGPDGVVTLSDVRLRPHTPDRLITQVAVVDWAPEEAGRAAATLGGGWVEWEQALGRALPSPGLRAWLRRSLGGALCGRPEKRLMNLVGVSNSGKSMLLSQVKAVWGSYVQSCNVGLFLKDARVDPFELDQLRLARVVTSAEPDKGGSWDAGFLKQITGLDPITSRGMYRTHAGSGGEWTPRFSLWVASNYVMRFPSDDRALSMRLTPVPFKQRFRLDVRDGGTEIVDEAERLDKELPVRLAARGPAGNWAAEGFAVWCMVGLVEWLNGAGSGVEAAEIMHERSDMVEEIDTAIMWVRGCVERGELGVTQHSASEVRAQPWVAAASAEWGSVGGGSVMVAGGVGSGATGLVVEEAYWSYRRWWEDEYGTGGDVVGGGGGRFAKKKAAFVEALESLYGTPTKTMGKRRFPGLVCVIGRWRPEPGPTAWTGLAGGGSSGGGPGWGESE